ncbi:tetratricopeptide repeat protein [Xanthobacter sp. DSM 14520]|uniref:bacteriophage N4 adsorption protein A n=1 Tax=Xanthobacter autotrophicus (strain ATCC BAA-1158 / Py2) TaxID=78245 RepID=UPI0037292EE1
MTTANPLRTALPSPSPRRPRGLKRTAFGLMLSTSVAVGLLAGAMPARAEPPELTGAAWAAADRAYAAQRDKKYSETVTYAREALKLRPDVPRLWLLLMDALEAQGKIAEAVAAGNQAIAAGITDQTLVARVRAQSKVLAQAPSLAANKALEASNPKAAVEAAKKAIALVPDDLSYRMLLVYALIADGQIEAAEKAAGEAVEVDPQSFLPRTLRGYLRERLGRIAEAEQDFDTALKDEVLSGATARDVRLVMADAAIAAGHPQRAIKLLEQVQPQDAAIAGRLRVARAQEKNPNLVPDKAFQSLPVPYQKCVDTPYGPSCSLVPATTPPGGGVSDTPGYDAALEAFNAYRDGNDALAETRIREALKDNPGNPTWRRLLVDTLERARKYKDLDVAIRDAIAQGDTDPTLLALRAANEKRLAEPLAEQAIKELARGKAQAAVTLARQAVERAPDALVFRIVLINALMAAGQLKEAEAAAAGAVADNPREPLPHVLRGYLVQKLGQRDEAVKEFDTALASPVLTDLEDLNFRLIAANAALAAGQAAEALKLLEPLDAGKNKEIVPLHKQAEALVKAPGGPRPALVQPVVLCQPTSYGIICSVFAGQSMQVAGAGLNPAAPGYAAASAAYAAFGRRDYSTAIAEARRAVDAEPGNTSYQVLLLNALTSAGRYQEAEAVANRLLAGNPRDVTLLVQRGNLRMRARDFTGAIQDFRAALASGRLPAGQVRQVRLSLADAGLSAKQPAIALDALAPYRGEASYEVQARVGFAALALDDKEGALEAFTLAAAGARSGQERMAMLTARIGVLSQLGRKEEARQLFLSAYNSGALRGMKAVDLAVLASQAGEDDLAYEYFSEANSRWQLRGTNLINAGYAARHTYHNAEAVDYFKSAIDEAREGKLQLDPQYLFGLRREVAELSRTWGAYASVSYGAVGVAPGSYLAPPSPGANHTIGAGGEIYWRPPGIGYRDGSIFELFVRGFGTLYSDAGGPTGFDTIQGGAGARWKPFKSENLVLEVSYLFPVGQYARDDVLLRAAYSKSEGTDLRVDVDNWRAWQIYADYNYFLMTPQTVATFEARYGHAWRLDALSDHLVLWPYLAIGGGYDTGYATPFALGAGPGATLRYWFNEDEYTAPRSYLDLTLQYRFKLAGDDRAEGIFAGAFLSY